MESTTKKSDMIGAESTPKPSFVTSEMIAENPLLEVAGLFAGDPLWQELREEIKRDRKQNRQAEAEGK